MSSIKKVVVAGATGNIGIPIVKALVEAGFEVTALTRQTGGAGTKGLPSGVRSVGVDYASPDSLAAALEGQDAVVSTIATQHLDQQTALIDAAERAGVRRFLPSEFGSNGAHPRAAALPVFQHKTAARKHLQDIAAKSPSALSHTFVSTGPFFDWGLAAGFIADLKGRSVTLYDGGNRLFSTTTLAHIGQAVVGVLRNPEATANRTVHVQSTALSGSGLLERAKAVLGADGWSSPEVSTEELLVKAHEELKADPTSPGWAYKFLFVCIFGEDYGSHFEKLDNDLFGIKQLTEDEIAAEIKKASG